MAPVEAIQMTADRKKPGVVFWATVVVVGVVLYVASVGPVYWIASRIPATNTMAGGRVLHLVYWPIWELPLKASVRHAFEDYARAGTAADSFNK
jgi:hypothetical protein